MTMLQRETTPKYWQMRETIRRKIASGEWPEGHQLPPERVMAEAYDISRVTVRSALSELAFEGVLDRRHGRGTFVAAPPAPTRSSSPHVPGNLIHMVCKPPHGAVEGDPFFTAILGVMSRLAATARRSLVITPLRPEDSFADYLAAHGALLDQAAGVIFSCYAPSDAEVLGLRERGLAQVLIGYPESRAHIAYLGGDHEDAAYQATRHLLEHGWRRIALLDGPWTSRVSQDRLNGYLRALQDTGVPVDPALIAETCVWDKAAGEAAVARLFGQTEQVDAMVSAGDWSSYGAIQALSARGLRLPEQMPMVVFDSYPWLEKTLPFSLSYMHEDRSQLADQAMLLLQEQIDGIALPGRYLRNKLRLVIGASCGCQAASSHSTSNVNQAAGS